MEQLKELEGLLAGLSEVKIADPYTEGEEAHSFDEV
jgi:hypothetical protein